MPLQFSSETAVNDEDFARLAIEFEEDQAIAFGLRVADRYELDN
jgi:hypothetical protein